MKLTINTTNEIVSCSTVLIVSLENNSTYDVYLLNKEDVTISDNKAYVWNLEVLFQDTIPMVSPVNFLSKNRIPKKDDYFLLKGGDKYTFSFDIDFAKLATKPSEFGNKNDRYGVYSLKLRYKDSLLIDKGAFRGVIESNEIKLLYEK